MAKTIGGLACLMLMACRAAAAKATNADVAPVSPPVASADSAVTAPPAASSSAARPCTNFRVFPFGRFAVPAGWCWVRTEEGDDQSGELRDDHGQVRMHYYQMSHGVRVGDACAPRPERRSVKEGHAGGGLGVPYRQCELEGREGRGTRECFSFSGQANLCTEPGDDSFSAMDVIRTLDPAAK